MDQCSYARKYKAIREPRCNKGRGCMMCLRKWADAVAKRIAAAVK